MPLSRFFALLVLALAMPYLSSEATTLDNLAECRSASTDNFSFRECVGLQHQASETLLSAIENSWREYLESTAGAEPTETVTTEDSAQSVSGNTNRQIERGSAGEPAGESEKIVGGSLVREESGTGNINITNETLLETDFPVLVRGDVPDISVAAQRERFEKLTDLYRLYRDQRCSWEGGLYGADRVDIYITACGARLNQERAQAISLQLSEKRALDANGTFYRGFYIEDAEGGIYQSCDRRQEWRMAGDTETLDDIAARFATIDRDNLEMAYLELRGDLESINGSAGVSGNLTVRSVNLLRAIDEADCTAKPSRDLSLVVRDSLQDSQVTDEVAQPVDTSALSDDITVDALGASGFLYGYFANWVSACAVEQNSVCMAQADSGRTGLGEWKLVVDRSLQRQWKIQLIPTSSDTVIGRAIGIAIDGVDAGARPIPEDGATIRAEVGITLVEGDSARLLINRMRNGQLLSLGWSLPSEIGTELTFSLTGITRALEFFDQNGQ